ncbi:MAG TPA: galactokinase [Bacteroidales bacterium]|nr:galactokinase [Bacteroidales bacterium]
MGTTILTDKFFKIYGNRNDIPVLFFAPGRVNLIGEHTDYNNGFVFPCAINYGTYVCVRKAENKLLKAASLNFDSRFEIEIDNFRRDETGEWINYPLGILNEFKKKNAALGGIEVLFYGDIPNGAGLSSSASIEMVTAFALNQLYSTGFSMIDMVKMSQSAENNFVGMNCGIMDQFAVGFGEKDRAIFLNCDSLEYEIIPIELNDYQLIIANSNKRRGLTDSKYNERRSECETAVRMLNKELKIDHLSQLSISQFEENKHLIEDPIIEKRARHVISENKRVLDAVKVLQKGNIEEFGILMNESHDSLCHNYEVTGVELDTLAYEARKLNGVLGSRMTGAGFGGCTVSIVKKSDMENFTRSLSSIYSSVTGLKPEFYLPEIGSGVGTIQ